MVKSEFRHITLDRNVGWRFLSIIASLIIGIPSLRLKGIYVALITLAFQEILRTTLIMSELAPITGGVWGIGALGGNRLPPLKLGILTQENALGSYFLGLILFFIAFIAILLFSKSRIGLSLTALRDSESAAASLGISNFRYKLYAFMFSSFIAGIIGAFTAHYQGVIAPQILGFSNMIMLLIMVVIGGIGTNHGPIIGAIIVTILFEYLTPIGLWRFVITGIVILIILMSAPTGIMGLLSKKFSRARTDAIEQDSVWPERKA